MEKILRARGTFKVSDFAAASLGTAPAPSISTALSVGVYTMIKHYSGDIVGESATIFTSAFDSDVGIGSYVAMESFRGAIGDRSGSYSSTRGKDRFNEFFAIVDGSGTGDLRGLYGAGGITIDPAGTHGIWLDYEIRF